MGTDVLLGSGRGLESLCAHVPAVPELPTPFPSREGQDGAGGERGTADDDVRERHALAAQRDDRAGQHEHQAQDEASRAGADVVGAAEPGGRVMGKLVCHSLQTSSSGATA